MRKNNTSSTPEKKGEDRLTGMTKYCFGACFVISVGLIIGGFIAPPMGVVDGSVLTAVGELLLFPAMLFGYKSIEMGMEVHFQKGDTQINIVHDDDEDKED